MKTHKFDVEDAKKHGIEKAILLEHLRFHQSANEGNPDLTFDGKPYAFIKKETIEKMYSYMNYNSVRKWLKELEDEGVLESCKPHAKGGYHLKYYHVFTNDISDQSNGTTDQSLNDISDHSSIVTDVNTINGSVTTEVDDEPTETELQAEIIANYLLDSICQWDETHRYNKNEPSTATWVKDIDRAIRLDGRTPDQLKYLIDFIFRTNHKEAQFWAPNIQSGKKLREQFDTVKNQIKAKVKTNEATKSKQYADAIFG